MNEQDPQNPESIDNFDRLLANRSEIAEFVNSFTSERVQRKAFEAVVCSLGLGDNVAAPTPGVERLHIVKQDVEPEQEQADPDETREAEPSSTRRRRSRGSAKKTFTVTRGLNFAPEGKPSLEQFAADKQPRTMDEKNLVACYYLSNMMGMQDVDTGDVLAVYQAAEWAFPSQPDVALRKTASRLGWIDTADSKSIKVVWKGENYLTSKMPADSKKSG